MLSALFVMRRVLGGVARIVFVLREAGGEPLVMHMNLVAVTYLLQFGPFALKYHVSVILMVVVPFMGIVLHEAVEVLVRHGLHEDSITSAEHSVICCCIHIIFVQIYDVFVCANAPTSVLLDEQPGDHGSHDSDGSGEFTTRSCSASVQKWRFSVVM